MAADPATFPILATEDRAVVDPERGAPSPLPREGRALGAAAAALLLCAGAAAVCAGARRGADPTGAADMAVGLAGDVAAPAGCAMAEKGSKCYKKVVWAMTQGIKKRPEWYPNLTKDSLFEDFQRHLSLDEDMGCGEPCPAPTGCKTAAPGSLCSSSVQWSMTDGISAHPEWYQGLTAKSPPELFQNHVHESNATQCPTPACNPQPFKPVTLFCWMVVRPDGYELPLVQAQLEKKVGAFACDGYRLVSSNDLAVQGVRTLVISTTTVTGYTRDGTSPNAPIFVEAWDKIRADGGYAAHDWVVKSDPDTVLVPDRLRSKLMPGDEPQNPYPPPFKARPDRGFWVPNCDIMKTWGAGWGDGWPMMYGSIEIVSKDAINAYFANIDVCKGAFAWQSMGEDAFLGLCLRKLEVGELFMRQGDGRCEGGDCTNPDLSAFHPRKDIGSWMECYTAATA